MKRLVMAIALTCVLSFVAMAGDMATSDAPAPAPSPTPQEISATPNSGLSAPGDIPTTDSPQPILDPGLSALLWVLGLVV